MASRHYWEYRLTYHKREYEKDRCVGWWVDSRCLDEDSDMEWSPANGPIRTKAAAKKWMSRAPKFALW